MGLLIFICITVFLLIRLNEIIGLHVGFKANLKDDERFSSEESTIEEVQPQQPSETSAQYSERSASDFAADIPYDFLDKAKKAFEVIFTAYADGDKKTLKDLLAPKLYSAFSMAIDDRRSRGETLTGVLARFVKAEVIKTDRRGDDMFITVRFVTEQSNVLRDRNGIILEGDAEFVEKRTDTWIFWRKNSAVAATWFLYEIIDG